MVETQATQISSNENEIMDRPPLVETPKEESDARIEKNECGMGEHEMKPVTKMPETPAQEKKSDEEKSMIGKTSSDVPPKKSKEKWKRGWEGTVTALAYISSVASLWRFPEMILKHGGVFAILYTIAYVAVGMPLLYAEIAIGQYTSCNHYGVFNHIAPIFTGLASCMTFILLVRSCVISVIQATTFAFLIATFHGHQYDNNGVTTCMGESHSPQCFNLNILNKCMFNQTDNFEECNKLERVSLLSGASQLRRTPFFDHVLTEFNVLPQTSSEYTWPHPLFIFSLFFTWILIAIVSIFGIRALSIISCAMVLPIGTFLGFMIYGFGYLPHSRDALSAFEFRDFKIDWSKLEEFHGVWTDAVSLVVFSLNLGNGGLIKLASHNEFAHTFTRDVNIISVYGYLFNYLTTLAILPYIHFISFQIYGNDANRAMRMWVDHGDFGLMNVIAETMTSRKGSELFIMIYFTACFILEFESTSISMHVVYSCLLDRIHFNYRPRSLTLLFLMAAAFFSSLFLITPGGIYAVKQMDRFFTIATIFTSFVQICVFMHIYGFKRFITNVRTMTGGSGPVNTFWWISWIIFTPIVLLAAFIMECLYFSWEDISIGNLVLTNKLKNFSWIIFVFCIVWFPLTALYRFTLTFKVNEKKTKLFKSTPEWGPAEGRAREDARFNERAMRVR